MTLRLTVIAAPLVLVACASQPAPLQGSFDTLGAHDAVIGNHSGASVRWGGRIIRTEPRPDRTCFEVVSSRLDANGRPYWTGDATWGRFIACRTGYYDPALFAPNREVTFTGRIEGYEDRRVGGGHVYKFPRVSADVVYLWPAREQVLRQRHSDWPWAWAWHW